MSTYAVGDIQGCFNTLNKLLAEINFDGKKDHIIFLGDIINRGPKSLEVLRLIQQNQDCMSMVLGNHDLYAIAHYLGAFQKPKRHTLDALFAAPDAPELFSFLRKQPLIKKIGQNIFVHAGILPAIKLDSALSYAQELSDILTGPDSANFLENFYSLVPCKLVKNISHPDMLKLSLSSFIFIRMCVTREHMDFSYSGPLEKAPAQLQPWFNMRHDLGYKIFFGHWAAIGYLKHKNYFALDAGCVWGKNLCAYRLDDSKVFLINNCED